MLRGALLAAFLVCATSSAHAVLGRDDQWTYVPATAEHGARAELRGDHPEGVPSLLIFQMECVRETRSISVRHEYDEREFSGPYPPGVRFELVIDYERTIDMLHQPSDDVTVRRLALNSGIAAAIEAGREFELYTPSESGHPWFLGEAPAFKRLVRECWGRSVG